MCAVYVVMCNTYIFLHQTQINLVGYPHSCSNWLWFLRENRAKEWWENAAMKVQKPIVGRMFLVVVLHGEGWVHNTEHYEQDTSNKANTIFDLLVLVLV